MNCKFKANDIKIEDGRFNNDAGLRAERHLAKHKTHKLNMVDTIYKIQHTLEWLNDTIIVTPAFKQPEEIVETDARGLEWKTKTLIFEIDVSRIPEVTIKALSKAIEDVVAPYNQHFGLKGSTRKDTKAL